jgi:hypothetical protein
VKSGGKVTDSKMIVEYPYIKWLKESIPQTMKNKITMTS